MSLLQLSTVADAAYGIKGSSYDDTCEFLERPGSSGGGLYPLELYFVLRNVENIESGVYHYSPLMHGLETIRKLEMSRQFLAELFSVAALCRRCQCDCFSMRLFWNGLCGSTLIGDIATSFSRADM